jgi:hypothetical protein
MGIPRVKIDFEFIDDEGNQGVVSDIDESEGMVEVETDDGDSYSLSLRELRSKLRDGDFVAVDPESEEAA